MQVAVSISWWRRVLFAFLATFLVHVLNTVILTIIMQARTDEPNRPFFRHGGEAQAGALFAIVGGYVAWALFLSLGAPLALLVPVRLQLHRWYGMLFVAAVLPLLRSVAYRSPDLRSFVRNAFAPNPLDGAIALCGVVACSLYLLLLRRALRRSSAVVETGSLASPYKI